MGKLETELLVSNKKAFVRRAILGSLAVTGLLAVGLMAPNAIQILKEIDPKGRRLKRYLGKTLNRARDNLLDQGYMEFVNTPVGKKFRLTDNGRKYLIKLEGKEYKLEKPKKWDGHFRIVTFDIREPRKYTREKLRMVLKQIGFYPLQRSVWVYPYDCEELITMLKADFKIGSDVLYVIANHIEFDKPIREYFNLPVPR